MYNRMRRRMSLKCIFICAFTSRFLCLEKTHTCFCVKLTAFENIEVIIGGFAGQTTIRS